MSAEGNIQTIQDVYAAFGRADGQTILDACTEDVDWGTDTSSTVAPWWGLRHGKEQVGAFFGDFGSNMEVSAFEPFSFTANDDEVHTMVRLVATRRANGKALRARAQIDRAFMRSGCALGAGGAGPARPGGC